MARATIAHSDGPPAGGPVGWLVAPLVWMRLNLFNGIANSILTLAVLALIGWAVPPLISWAFIDSIVTGDTADACKVPGAGACWVFVEVKWRQILFGRYPYAEQWRSAIAMLILIGVAVASCDRRLWNLRLLWVWGIGLLLFFWLMGGGLGLTPVPTRLWGGLPLTLMLSFVGMVVAFPVAILLALGRRSSLPLIKAMSIGYIELIRGVPLISLLFMASFMLPLFMPSGVQIDAVLRAQVAIILFAAAYLAETIRGGLQALPKGQTEASHALGLSFWQSQRMIVLPQALKIAIPPIVNTFIGMFKDTSLVAIVSLTDLLLATRQALIEPEWRIFFIEAYCVIAVIYWVFCFSMSRYSQYLERVLNTGHRR